MSQIRRIFQWCWKLVFQKFTTFVLEIEIRPVTRDVCVKRVRRVGVVSEPNSVLDLCRFAAQCVCAGLPRNVSAGTDVTSTFAVV